MKTLLILLVAVAGALAFNPDLNEDWEKFKNAYNKVYAVREEGIRRMIFEKHVDVIAKHNRQYDLGLKSYFLGLNEFADLTNFEFRNRMTGLRSGSHSKAPRTLHAYPNEAYPGLSKDIQLPDSVDWSKKGAVTDIKNQQQCGSCWAFSTTGSVEGQHFLKTKKLVSLSEQNLVDCSRAEGNMGCEGGLMDYGFEYIIKNKGIDTEASYPYTAEDGTCQFDPSNVGATISSYVDVATGDEKALQKAVANVGPISVGIDASQESFQLYSGGVYDEENCSTTQLDHGVLAVGYDTDSDSGKDYWLVKNSWGKSWGISGYIKMSRNNANQCGIATSASYPVV